MKINIRKTLETKGKLEKQCVTPWAVFEYSTLVKDSLVWLILPMFDGVKEFSRS